MPAGARSRAPAEQAGLPRDGVPGRPGGRRLPVRGRGSTFQPRNRFAAYHYVADAPAGFRVERHGVPAPGALRTRYLPDASRGIVARNDSPDVPFEASINPYRGCEHGCSYCYARPTHEFLGLSAGLDFESRILVKHDAPALLRAELERRRWRPQVLALSGVTDPYQPVERRLGITRRCLEVLAEFRNPVAIVTKSRLVTRDIDLLQELARHRCVRVTLSVTTLRARLSDALEPRAARPAHRLRAIHALAEAGIPVGMMAAPVIPGLTDEELPAIVQAAADAGAQYASYALLRLPHAVKDLFEDWLDVHAPQRKTKVLSRLRSLRGGALNDARFGHRMRGVGPFARQLEDLFELGVRRARLQGGPHGGGPRLNTAAFRRPGARQLQLFQTA